MTAFEGPNYMGPPIPKESAVAQGRPDPPELSAAIDMLREIYWREYGRGWRDAVENVKRVLEQVPPSRLEGTG